MWQPDWSNREHIFLFVLLINLIISVIYLIWGLISAARSRDGATVANDRAAYIMRFFIMILCPVITPLLFLIANLFYLFIFRRAADLEDVIFSKERVNSRVMADEDREKDIIPLEEAMLINEKKDLRSVMMNVIRGDITESLSAITLALTSGDSEASHYAASVLTNELNKFRDYVQNIRKQIEEKPDQPEYSELLIDYMNGILKQHVFSNFEHHKFVEILDDEAEALYEKNPSSFNLERYEELCLRLLEVKDYKKSEKWADRLAEHYPEELPSYTCKLKLYFAERDKKAFFDTLNRLKKSNVVIDYETLELIRVFG